MESVQLDTPEGISARLGWDPGTSEHDRLRILASRLVAERLGVNESDVKIEREAPTIFGHHTQLGASVNGEPVALSIKTASFRAASVVAVCPPDVSLGLDIRDRHPDASALSDMRHHSHLWPESDEDAVLWHWSRVQAVLQADKRGTRTSPDFVRLDPPLGRAWMTDGKDAYRLVDLSRNGFVITLAYGEPVRV